MEKDSSKFTNAFNRFEEWRNNVSKTASDKIGEELNLGSDTKKDATIDIEKLNIYIQNNHILKDISLQLHDKKITCIIGPSGCGKTTLLKSINRMIDTTEHVRVEGRVFVDGEDIYDKKAEITHIRKKIGLLSQRPTPLPMSIYDNITFGCRIHGMRNKKTLDKVVEKYLHATGLWDEVKDRLHTPASALSIGQQQRLCLARGLAVEPQFILADESTSAQELQQLVDGIFKMKILIRIQVTLITLHRITIRLRHCREQRFIGRRRISSRRWKGWWKLDSSSHVYKLSWR